MVLDKRMGMRALMLTNAYNVGIKLVRAVSLGSPLPQAVASVTGPPDCLTDGYPSWHPAPHSFEGLIRLFLYREVTGESYRDLAQYSEFAEKFGLAEIPDESVLSRAWRNRFDETGREFITTAAHYAVKEIHNRDLDVPAARPKAEVVTPSRDPSAFSDDEQESDQSPDADEDNEFTTAQIHRTTRLARDHAFGSFDSGRAQNASHDDMQFFELQTFMGMVGCGTAQGAARFQHRRGAEYGPHGDTHLRAVKQFDLEDLLTGFDRACDRLLSVIGEEASFRRPVTAAIDITTVPYYGDVEAMPMVNGMQGEDMRTFKFATLSIIDENVPLVLAVEPIRESSAWDDNRPNQVHRVVRRLVRRAKEHLPIETVLCDREFDSMAVFQTLSNLDVNYLIPKRISRDEREAIAQMEEDSQDVAVERVSVDVTIGSHAMRFLYVPSTKGDRTAVFATNLPVGPEEAETFCHRYSRRWRIENEYKSIKNDFLAKTSSKDYRVRLFYFIFAALLHNIWRLTDFLLKAAVEIEIGETPVLTAGECVEVVSSDLISAD